MWKIFSAKILNGQSQTITSAALVLALASLVSRLLGLVRDRMLAGQFGAGDTLDIYYAAFRAPDMVYNLLIMGALSAGFIPVFVSLWRESQDNSEAWHFFNSLLNLLLIGLLVVGALLFIFTPQLMRLITPGFSGEKLDLTIALTRIMFLSPLLLGLSSLWGGVLQSLKRFLVFSLTPIFYNLGIIFGIVFLVPRLGIYGLAWGVVLGAAAHMAIQLPTLFSLGFRYQPILDWRNKGVARLARLMVPRTLTLAVSQLNFMAITVLASFLAAGSLAVFNLAYNIWTFPLGILAASLATAAFPVLAKSAADKDDAGFTKTFSATFRQILFLMVPASVLLVVLRAQIVRVILGVGNFDWNDTILTINSLQYLTVGLFAEGLILLLVRGFFAFEDTRTPFWLGLVSSIFRVAGAWFFALYMGVAGLALGYAAGSLVNLMLLWIFLEKKTGDLNFGEVFKSAVKIFAASFLAGIGAYWALRLLDNWLNTEVALGLFAQGLLAGIAGLLIYFLIAFILRLPEMEAFCRSIKDRLPFKSVAPDKEIIQD
ncbi:MAG TPA: murein biosynthesis integral membrane protein MurJ [Candidatus Portnoybacteria bacterium]|nr:murein biosynthesis integral membrane protein MurJ [Candidatus Portnoybacteria bacterium]